MPVWAWIVIGVVIVVALLIFALRKNDRSTEARLSWYESASPEEIAAVDQDRLVSDFALMRLNIHSVRKSNSPEHFDERVSRAEAALEKIRAVSPEAAEKGMSRAERIAPDLRRNH